jgi:UrcA family protein
MRRSCTGSAVAHVINPVPKDVAMLNTAEQMSSNLLGCACAVIVLAMGSPALSQGTDGFTVLGHDAEPVAHGLTAGVRYRDLDLSTRDGRVALRARVRKTAEKLCARIGESDFGSATPVLSCEDQAVYDAGGQMKQVIAEANVARSPAQSVIASGGPRMKGAPGNDILTVRVAAAR